MANEYMSHQEIQETAQGVYLYPVAVDGSNVNTPIKYDGMEWLVKPDQSARVQKAKTDKGAKGAVLEKDMTTHTLSAEVVMYESLLLPLLMILENRTDASTLITPTPDGTNGQLWEMYIREGQRSYMQEVFGLFGDNIRHQQVSGIAGKSLKVSFSTDGQNQNFSIEMGAVGNELRDPKDGGTALTAIPSASALNDFEVDPSTICVFASDVSQADLDRRAMIPQVTAAHTLAGTDDAATIASAVQTLLEGLANVNGSHVTVTGSGGPLGTADVELDVEFTGDFAGQEIWDTKTEDNYGMIQIGGSYTGTTATVSKQQVADGSSTNEIQRITIPSDVTGDMTFTVNLGNTVLMPELMSYEWSVDNRNEKYRFARCSTKNHNRENCDSSQSFEHMANDYGMQHLARVRGNDTRIIWVMLRAMGPVIEGASPSRYYFELSSPMLVKTLNDLPFKDGWKAASYDGELATDPDFISAGNGGVARARLCCTQTALFVQ